MVLAAKERQFQTKSVIFNSWYASIDNLKLIRSLKWHWFTRMKCNRQVNPDKVLSIVQFPRLRSILKGEYCICANRDSSRFSRWSILMEMLNIWPPIFLTRQSPTGSRSKIADGISKSIIAVLSNAAESNDVRAVKIWSSVAISFSHYSLSFVWNPIG